MAAAKTSSPSDGEVGLSGARRAEDKHVLAMRGVASSFHPGDLGVVLSRSAAGGCVGASPTLTSVSGPGRWAGRPAAEYSQPWPRGGVSEQ